MSAHVRQLERVSAMLSAIFGDKYLIFKNGVVGIKSLRMEISRFKVKERTYSQHRFPGRAYDKYLPFTTL